MRPKMPLADQRLAFHRQRAQAKYRNEPWALTFEQWWGLWQTQWSQRGMGRDDLCMIRENLQRPWELGNVRITTRAEYLCRGSLWDRRSDRRRRGPKRPKV